mmetsp:Transcript_127381/g.407717  ORF Transcript_127381/g.407717 Transcript_127381/m.407717 type:complete len:222 (+) Transcript_127381:476-1141(+)
MRPAYSGFSSTRFSNNSTCFMHNGHSLSYSKLMSHGSCASAAPATAATAELPALGATSAEAASTALGTRRTPTRAAATTSLSALAAAWSPPSTITSSSMQKCASKLFTSSPPAFLESLTSTGRFAESCGSICTLRTTPEKPLTLNGLFLCPGTCLSSVSSTTRTKRPMTMPEASMALTSSSAKPLKAVRFDDTALHRRLAPARTLWIARTQPAAIASAIAT